MALGPGVLLADDETPELPSEVAALLLLAGFELLLWPNDPSAGNSFGSNPTSLADDTDGALVGVAAGGFGLK